jgi:predicted transcriptional regulator
MGAIPLQKEFLEILPKLSEGEQESLLTIARNYLHLRQESVPIDVEQYNLEIDESMKEMDAGEVISQEEVRNRSKSWSNVKKAN